MNSNLDWEEERQRVEFLEMTNIEADLKLDVWINGFKNKKITKVSLPVNMTLL